MQPSTIIVLGGPAAGKTIFLSVLYRHLWQGYEQMTMRAGTGTMHSELLSAADAIEQGTFPPATQALRHYDFELRHGRHNYQLRFLDYPGELFRKVFYETAVDSDEARQLYDSCMGADAVIALVDPRSILDGTWDIDYAMTTLLRFYTSNGRKQPKFVLAFTKRDRTRDILDSSITRFVREHLPHLSSELGHGMHLVHFCSLAQSGPTTTLAQPETVSKPLITVLQALEADESARHRERHFRRLKWKRAAIASLFMLLVAILIFVAFVWGVYCRHTDVNRSPVESVYTNGL